MFGAVADLHEAAVGFQPAVVVAPCAVAAAELVAAVSAAEGFVTGAPVAHDVAVAVAVAGPRAPPKAFARGHCFVVN